MNDERNLPLAGRAAIVTGAGRGLGRAHALQLAADGAAVVVNDPGQGLHGEPGDERPAEEVVREITKHGGRAVANFSDCSDWSAAEGLVQQSLEAFGRLDILVNNAGIVRDRMSFTMSEQEWDSVIAVHLKGHFASSRAAASHWRERAKAGDPVDARIINTSSESGLLGSVGQTNYAAAKAAIAGMTLVMAAELGRYGVTVNAIAPRARTRMTEGVARRDQVDDGFDDRDPAHVATFVSWLAGPEAAGISGQVFIVYGSTIVLLEGWRPVRSVDRGRRAFRREELDPAVRQLFDGRSSATPSFALEIDPVAYEEVLS